MNRGCFITITCLLCCPALANQSNPNSEDVTDLFAAAPVDDEQLNEQRGGFVLPNGVIVNIAIEKRILQNGELTFFSYFDTTDNLPLANGAGVNGQTIVDPSMASSIIQNNLDNQTISSLNLVDVELTNLDLATSLMSNYQINEFYFTLIPGQ